MIKFGVTMLLLCAASLTVSAAGIDGKWTSEMQVGDTDGKTYSHISVFTLKNDGGLLTGTYVATSEAPWMRETTGKSFNITDGKIDGDKFSFKVVQEGKTGQRVTVYDGTMDGDRLKGIIKYRGIGQTRLLDARRMK